MGLKSVDILPCFRMKRNCFPKSLEISEAQHKLASAEYFQDFDVFFEVFCCRVVKRRLALIVSAVHVGAMFDENWDAVLSERIARILNRLLLMENHAVYCIIFCRCIST